VSFLSSFSWQRAIVGVQAAAEAMRNIAGPADRKLIATLPSGIEGGSCPMSTWDRGLFAPNWTGRSRPAPGISPRASGSPPGVPPSDRNVRASRARMRLVFGRGRAWLGHGPLRSAPASAASRRRYLKWGSFMLLISAGLVGAMARRRSERA